MATRSVGVFTRAVLAVGGLLLSLTVAVPVRAQEVIVNADVVDRSASQNTLRAIFNMRQRQWPSGKPVKVFVLPDDNALHVLFAKRVLNTYPHQLRRSWDLLVFSGSGQAPTVVESPKEMLLKVSSTPGAVGYLPDNYLEEGGKNENVHILEVR